MSAPTTSTRNRKTRERNNNKNASTTTTTATTTTSNSARPVTPSFYAAGEDLKVGSAVKLCGLASAQGQTLNEKAAYITNDIRKERYGVKLVGTGERKLIKPSNLRIVCNYCHADRDDFYTCEDCEMARYCGPTCQKNDWKKQPIGHKHQCNTNNRRNTD